MKDAGWHEMKRFYLPSEKIGGDQALLDGPEAYHLRTVMRLGPGDHVVVFDGTGNAYDALITAFEGRQVRLSLTAIKTGDGPSDSSLTLAQGYLKDKKMDNLVRPLTELGLSRWIPFVASRSVPAPDKNRLEARLNRWRKLSLEAMKQCRRNHPLLIDMPCSFDEVLRQADSCDLKLMFWEQADAGFTPEGGSSPANKRVFVLIGPEGGFDPAEVAAARDCGFLLMGLGPRILRAETATLAACTLIQYLWGDMGNAAKFNLKTA